MLNINEANIGTAILQNYERAQDILETAEGSNGSALAENEKYLNSIQGHLDQLQAKWESFSVKLADSSLLKGIIDGAGTLVTLLDKAASAFGGLGIAAASVMGILSKTTNFGLFQTFEKVNEEDGTVATEWGTRGQAKEAAQKMAAYQQSITNKKDLANLEKMDSLYRQVADGELTLVEADDRARNIHRDLSDGAKEYGAQLQANNVDIEKNAETMDKYKKSVEDAEKAQKNAKKGAFDFSASLKSMAANVGAALAVAAAFQVLSTAWDAINSQYRLTDSAKQEARDSRVSAYTEATEEAQTNIDTLKSLESEYNQLAKGVDAYGNNVGLSASEYERYNEIANQIASISPDLVKGYTSEGNAILDRNSAISEGIALQEEYQKTATRSYSSNKSINELIDGFKADSKDAFNEARTSLTEVADMYNRISSSATAYKAAGKSANLSASGKSISSDLINNIIGEDMQSGAADLSQLQAISQRRNEILHTAQQSGEYTKTELADLGEYLDDVASQTSIIEEYTQPIYDALTSWAQLQTDDVSSAIASIPEEAQSSFQAGLKQISQDTSLSAAEMKMEANSLATDLDRLYTENASGGKGLLGYQEALAQLDKAKETLGDSTDEADVEAYQKSVSSATESLRGLADAQEAAGNTVLADSLRAQATEIESYASVISESLTEAFNPYTDEFADAANMKSNYDTWKESITDYADGIASAKEVLDDALASTETGGYGTKSFWEAASLTLGDKNVKELDGNIDKVKSKMTELQSAMEDGETATGYFYDQLGDNADAINTVLGKDAVSIKDGMVNFDINESEWEKVADVLGISEDSMMALLSAAQQFANIDLQNTDAVRNALKNQETTVNKDGAMFALAEPIEKEAQEALGSYEAAHRRIQELNKESDISLIDTTSLKDNFKYSEKELKAQGSAYKDYVNDAKAAAQVFNQMGYGKANANGKVLSFSAEDIEGIATELLNMGGTAEDVYATMKGFETAGIKLPDDYAELSDEELQSTWEDFYTDYQKLNSEEQADPFESISSSLDKVCEGTNKLIALLGGIPDVDLTSNTKHLDTLKQELESGELTQEQSKQKVEAYQNELDSLNEKIALEQTAYNNMAEGSQKDEYGKQLEKDKAKAEEYAKALAKVKKQQKDNNKNDGSSGGTKKVNQKKLKQNLNQGLSEDLFGLSLDQKNAVIDVAVQYSTTGDADALKQSLKDLGFSEGKANDIVEKVVKITEESSGSSKSNKNSSKDSKTNKTTSSKSNKSNTSKLSTTTPTTGAKGQVVTATVNYKIGKQDQPTTGEAPVNYTKGQQINPIAKTATVNYKKGKQEEPKKNYTGTLSLTVSLKTKIASVVQKIKNAAKNGGSGASGTANRRVFNSAAGGKLGPRGNGGLTLTGELGPELVWLPSQNSSMIVGLLGPEMVDLPSDAVVYPADETRRIVGDEVDLPRPKFGSMATGSYKYSSSKGSGAYSKPRSGSYSKNSSSSSSSSSSKKKSKKKSPDDKYESEKKKLDHQLAMEEIDDQKYYEKLYALYKKYKNKLSADTKRSAQEANHEAYINAFKEQADLLQYELDMNGISAAEYYQQLLDLGIKYYTKDGEIREGYEDEWREWQTSLDQARKSAYEDELKALDRQLKLELIDYQAYYNNVLALQEKYLSGDEMADDLEEATDTLQEQMGSSLDSLISDMEHKWSDADLFKTWDSTTSLDTKLGDIADMISTINNLYQKGAITQVKYNTTLLELERKKAELMNSGYSDQKSNLDSIFDLVEKLVRQEAQDRIDALNDANDAYQELIDKKKEALQITEDELSFEEELADKDKEIAKIQSQLATLQFDDSRSARAKRAELQDELAELIADKNKIVREETVSRTEDALDKSAEKYSDLTEDAVEVIQEFLDNTSAVLNKVVEELNNQDTNNLLERLNAYNAYYGDGMKLTVAEFRDQTEDLITKYGDKLDLDFNKILSELQRANDDNLTRIQNNTDYGLYPVETHHSGLLSGFTGDGADRKQKEIYSKLLNNELVLNRNDQIKLASQLQMLDTVKSAFNGLTTGVAEMSTTNNMPITVNVTSNVELTGANASEVQSQLENYGDTLADATLSKLTDALQLKGVRSSATKNARKLS